MSTASGSLSLNPLQHRSLHMRICSPLVQPNLCISLWNSQYISKHHHSNNEEEDTANKPTLEPLKGHHSQGWSQVSDCLGTFLLHPRSTYHYKRSNHDPLGVRKEKKRTFARWKMMERALYERSPNFVWTVCYRLHRGKNANELFEQALVRKSYGFLPCRGRSGINIGNFI